MMTPDERNQIYEVLMMIDTSLELIIKRAKAIILNCHDKHLYVTQLKSNCANNAKEILEMAQSIEKRKGPAFKMIEEQRKGRNVVIDKPNERPFPV